jgi:hypothetical protein
MMIASLESSTIFYRDKAMEQCTQIAVQRDQLLQSNTLLSLLSYALPIVVSPW